MTLKNIENMKFEDIDLDFVKEYLRVDYDDDDRMIEMMMVSAKSFMKNVLNLDLDVIKLEFGEIPSEFNIPFLAIINHWYDRREVQSHRNTEKELSYVFRDVLFMFRNWNVM